MKTKSQALAKKIAALNAEFEAAKQAESDAADRELIRLCRKANCRDEAIKFAQGLIDQERRGKASARDADQVPDE